MPTTLSKTQGLAAFKEWAVSCKALGQGKQVMLFRKGGIREKDHQFKLEHPYFFLFPTYEHQDPQSIKPEFHSLLQASLAEKPDLGEVVVTYWAQVDQAWALSSMEMVLQQEGNHIFSPACVQARWEWQPKKPLWLLLLRVYELASPLKLTVQEEYTGCKSWVDFQMPLSEFSCHPVLDELSYAAMAAKVKVCLA